MVDFSCALKLAMPISVLSAIREANIILPVKGGKYLEAVAEADTIVFDKTGTLTKAKPTVKDVVYLVSIQKKKLQDCSMSGGTFSTFHGKSCSQMQQRERNLSHEEMHSKVEYIVAHGISSYIKDKKVVSEVIILYLRMRSVHS